MTPEAKAREIAREWYVSFADPKNDIRFFSANMRADFVEKQIVQALLTVERETLERAAIAAENDEHSICGSEVAKVIRALLQKEGG